MYRVMTSLIVAVFVTCSASAQSNFNTSQPKNSADQAEGAPASQVRTFTKNSVTEETIPRNGINASQFQSNPHNSGGNFNQNWQNQDRLNSSHWPGQSNGNGQFSNSQFNGQSASGQQLNGRQFNGQQFNGQQFNGQQFDGQQFSGQQNHGQRWNGQQYNGQNSANETFQSPTYGDAKFGDQNRLVNEQPLTPTQTPTPGEGADHAVIQGSGGCNNAANSMSGQGGYDRSSYRSNQPTYYRRGFGRGFWGR